MKIVYRVKLVDTSDKYPRILWHKSFVGPECGGATLEDALAAARSLLVGDVPTFGVTVEIQKEKYVERTA